MKARILAALLTVIFIVISVCGCGSSANVDNGDNSDITSGTSSEPSTDADNSDSSDSSDSSDNSDNSDSSDPNGDNSDVQPPEEKDYFTKYGHGMLPEASDIPVSYTVTEINHLYSLGLELPESEGYSVFINGDTLYLQYFADDERMCSVYSLVTLELLAAVPISAWSSTGKLDNGGIWIIDFAELKVECIDKSGVVTTMFEGKAIDEDNPPQEGIVTSDGKYMLVSYGLSGDCELYDLTTGEVTVPEELKALEVWYMEMVGEKILLSVFPNPTQFFFDPKTQTAERVISKDSVGTIYGNLHCNANNNTLILTPVNTDDKSFYMELDPCESILDIKFGYAAIEDYLDSRVFSFNDLRTSSRVAEVELSNESIGVAVRFLDNGRVFMLENFYDAPSAVYVYDLPSAAKENNATEIKTLLCTDDEIQSFTKAIADQVFADYGIEILYDSQGNDFLLYDYVGVAELDDYKVFRAVRQTADVLALYPENMLRETYESTNQGMKFYLCGTLYGTSAGTLTTAGAVTSEHEGYIVIAYDINDPLEYNIPHELSHAFDRRINHVILSSEIDWMEVWESATPVSKPYLNSYEDYENHYSYTYVGETDEDDIWFTDSYARTFPTEDRARIMEYLFNPEEGELASILQNDNLIYKAKLYSYILRQCFPSCNTEDVLYWETYLGEIDSSVLE